MKLRRLAIRQLPGIDKGFVLQDIGDGIQVIVGPNGIGKSSLIRALRALLWAGHGTEDYVGASATFDGDGERWNVERDGSRHRWQRDGMDSDAPPLPAAHLDACFFLVLRDLLDATDDRGADLARRIRRQMSGGFDIEEVARTLSGTAGPRFGASERRSFDDTEQALKRASGQQEKLARQEANLSELEEELAHADAALGRPPSYDDALALLRLREKLERVSAEISGLPRVLKDLSGNELEEVDRREAELAEHHRRRNEAEVEREVARKDATDTRLAEPLEPTLLTTLRRRAEALGALEAKREDAANESAKRRGERIAAVKAAGGREDEALAIDLTGAKDLFGFLRKATSVATEGEAIAHQLEIIKGVTHSRESEQRLERLREGIGTLRAWLRAPDPEQQNAGGGKRKRFILFWTSAALAVMGVVLAIFVHRMFAMLVTAGLGIAVATWFLRPIAGSSARREAAEREFPPDLDPPAQWSEGAVSAMLRDYEREAAELEASAKRADYADADRTRLETHRANLETKKSGLERRRTELATALNLEAIPPDAELVHTALALDALRQALRTATAAEEAEKTLTEKYRSMLAELSAELIARGEPEITDAAAAHAAVESLGERNNRLRDARTRERAASRTLDQVNQDVARIEKIVVGIYRKAGTDPGDRAGLQRLMDGLPGFKKLGEEGDQLRIGADLAEKKLVKAGELSLIERSEQQLAADKQHLEAQGNRRRELQDQIADIRADVRKAREGHDLEDAIALRESRRVRLVECRDRALHAAAGGFLLSEVKREHETNQMPRVLERARDLFGRFTHQAYELRVAADEAGSFMAVDVDTGVGKRPDQLSDGTRAQLLLAARLAFAEQAEHGASLPLFLDEALDQSDPTRFHVIARSLGRMATDEGRQIFYLTNDPTDAERIRNALNDEQCDTANVIDLLAVRRGAAGVPDAESLRVEDLPDVPEPAGMTPEIYGTTLKVAPFDPRRSHGAQHLLYLLWDDLPLMHRLLVNRIESVGQWQNLSRRGAHLVDEIVAGPGAGPELDARVHLLEAFCATWREGRGRPVDRAAIEQSKTISERYLDNVADIAAELDGDAARLVEVLRERGDERLHGFRTHVTDALEGYLIDEGYIDRRPVLAESDLTARLLTVPAAGKLPDRTVAECIHRWWQLAERA